MTAWGESKYGDPPYRGHENNLLKLTKNAVLKFKFRGEIIGIEL